jgi:hypothetical protein
MDARAQIEPERTAFRVEPVDSSAMAGGTGHLNLSVTNTGTGTYTDITSRVFLSGPLSSPDTETHIDSLGAGESTTVAVPVAASSAATAKTFPTSLILKYDDEAGERRASDTFRQGVAVTAPEDDSSGPGLLPVVGVVVCIALLGYGFYRLRRR